MDSSGRPAARSASAAPSAPADQPATSIGGSETVLVVDDQDIVRGFADKALHVPEREPGVSPMIADIALPGMNGRMLVDAARKR
jgi:hypothetical protein